LQQITDAGGSIFVQPGSQLVLWPLGETTASAVLNGDAEDRVVIIIARLFSSTALA